MLPDGTIAKVAIDFDTLREVSAAARRYGMGGAVQHGASTLPAEYFHKFPEVGTVEVCSAKVGTVEVGFAKVSTEEGGLTKIYISEVCIF